MTFITIVKLAISASTFLLVIASWLISSVKHLILAMGTVLPAMMATEYIIISAISIIPFSTAKCLGDRFVYNAKLGMLLDWMDHAPSDGSDYLLYF